MTQIHMAQLIAVENGLAFHVKTGMNAPGTTGRTTALTRARLNGWTHKQTNRGALLDIIAFRRVIEGKDYEPSDYILSCMGEADQKKVPGIIKRADLLVKQMDKAHAEGGEQMHWRGTDSLKGLK